MTTFARLSSHLHVRAHLEGLRGQALALAFGVMTHIQDSVAFAWGGVLSAERRID